MSQLTTNHHPPDDATPKQKERQIILGPPGIPANTLQQTMTDLMNNNSYNKPQDIQIDNDTTSANITETIDKNACITPENPKTQPDTLTSPSLSVCDSQTSSADNAHTINNFYQHNNEHRNNTDSLCDSVADTDDNSAFDTYAAPNVWVNDKPQTGFNYPTSFDAVIAETVENTVSQNKSNQITSITEDTTVYRQLIFKKEGKQCNNSNH